MLKLIPFILFALTTVTASAADGEQLSRQCAACHGVKGISPGPVWPNLAGQKAEYLATQIKLFQSGERNEPQMSPFVANLTEADINALADYYASLPSASKTQSESEVAAVNTRAFCISCHGIKGESVNSEWPNLAGQKSNYILKQLKDYKSGKRKNPLMNQIASEINQQQMDEIADYYSKL